MRFAPELLQLISLIFLLSYSILHPATARPLAPAASNVRIPHGLDLGGGWTFSFTNQPALLYPVEQAAGGMRHLYDLAKLTASNTARDPRASLKMSTAIVFRVGHFALIFDDNFDASYGDTFRALVLWPAIATFCERMLNFVDRGEVLYYEGIIKGTGGSIRVRLRLMEDGGGY